MITFLNGGALKNVLLGAEINKSVSQETKQRAKELLRQYGLKRFINSRRLNYPVECGKEQL